MDWDFWLRCANKGYWGGTVPEFLDWYRRRPAHTDLWPDFDEGPKQRAYGERLRHKYGRLWSGGFPEIHAEQFREVDELPEDPPCENRLQKNKPRLLMLIPWMSLWRSGQIQPGSARAVDSARVGDNRRHHPWRRPFLAAALRAVYAGPLHPAPFAPASGLPSVPPLPDHLTADRCGPDFAQRARLSVAALLACPLS